jgi:hypothetical protein
VAWIAPIGAEASLPRIHGRPGGYQRRVDLKWRLAIGIAAALRAVLIPGEAGTAMSWSPRLPALDLSPAPSQADGALAFATGAAGTS